MKKKRQCYGWRIVLKDEIKEIKISKSNHSIVIIKNGVTVKEQFAIDDEILDYITNLQKENERLNKTLEKVQQEYTDEYNLRHKLSFELSVEKDRALELSEHLTMYSSEETMLKEIEQYKSRIDKAIKLLKEAGCYEEESKQFYDDIWEELPDILNALEGSDKE